MEYLSAFIYRPISSHRRSIKKNCKGLQLVKCASSVKRRNIRGRKLSVLLYCIIFKTTVLGENCVFSLPSHGITCLKISLRKMYARAVEYCCNNFYNYILDKIPASLPSFLHCRKSANDEFHL